MKKVLLCLLTASLLSPAVAQENFEFGKPNDANYRYLDEYKALKEYIDNSKYPNFKLGAGTTVNDYLTNNTFKNLINKNFSETVAGNAQLYIQEHDRQELQRDGCGQCHEDEQLRKGKRRYGLRDRKEIREISHRGRS